MIELKNVTKQFESAVTAVDQISFKVLEGETFGLIGTSGCGKTTTLKMINRLIEPTSGEILLNSKSIIHQPAEQLRRNIGYVIQNVGLFPHYTIQENISVVPKLLSWDQKQINERSNELLELVGLEPEKYAARTPDALSGGQQQRVGLARALAGNPEVLLMDEPFGALDPITKEDIRGEFKKLLANLNKTVILVTHDVFEAFDLCDRICLMDRGKARQIGTPRELLFQPQSEFVRSFFDAHRLQLEMMSVTIGDILQALKSRSGAQYRFPDSRAGSSEYRLKKEGDAHRSFSEGDESGKAESTASPDASPDRLRGKQASGEGKTSQSPSTKEDAPSINLGESFFSVFEDMHTEAQRFTVLDEVKGPVAAITAEELLEGFQQVRRNLREGRDA